MATHGATPAKQPNQNGFMVTVDRPGGLASSCSQPKRIIATLAPAIPMSAEIPSMPV
jgi:hypothetical protein